MLNVIKSANNLRLAYISQNPINTPWAYIQTKDKFDRPILEGRAYIRGAYIREEKHFNLQSVKLTFLSFFQDKAYI